ncbi:MAG TPA: tRNA (guanosine(46)-N7)-methyltransferase TrmB, partial [Candidatus Bathyarchaeia archaeon]|nr:tRNA (guanosine(46)-N7)-methyltransferase TrmB [Candidatus Bathyarchaeia archaeon]
MRLRNIPGVEQALLQYPTFIEKPLENKGRWHEYFGNNHPIHIEIGCGKGRFITTLA